MTWILLLALFVLPSLPAYSSCQGSFTSQFVRSPTGIAASSIAANLAGFSTSPLIRELQAMHVKGYQEYWPAVGGIRQKKFLPFWVFQSASALELLKQGFPEGYAVGEPGAERSFQGIDGFVDQWARDFARAGGDISPLWPSRRQAWLQKLIVELGLQHQAEVGVGPEEQPPPFARHEDSELSLLPGYDAISAAFGDTAAFQDTFRDAARQDKHLRTPPGVLPQVPSYRQAMRHLRNQGIPVRGQRQPFREQDKLARDRLEFLQAAQQRMLAEGNRRYPFAPLFAFSSSHGHASQAQAGMQEAQTLFHLFGDGQVFVAELQKLFSDREEPFVKQEDTWEKEFLVQAACQFVLDNGGLQHFSGFQTFDPAVPFYLETLHPIYQRAEMTVWALNRKVRTSLSGIF